jgi:hypothetical protein
MTEYSELAARALALADDATPGPWCVDWTACAVRSYFKSGMTSFADHEDADGKEINYRLSDAELMTASRTLIPDLANALLTVLKERDVLQRALELKCGELVSIEPCHQPFLMKTSVQHNDPAYWIEKAKEEVS